MNSIDVYVPSINCFPGDAPADVVVVELVSAAAVAPGEVSWPLEPAATPVVPLALALGVAVESVVLVLVLDFDVEVDVATALDAKPGDKLVFEGAIAIMKLVQKPNKTYRFVSGRYQTQYRHSSSKQRQATTRH